MNCLEITSVCVEEISVREVWLSAKHSLCLTSSRLLKGSCRNVL